MNTNRVVEKLQDIIAILKAEPWTPPTEADYAELGRQTAEVMRRVRDRAIPYPALDLMVQDHHHRACKPEWSDLQKAWWTAWARVSGA